MNWFDILKRRGLPLLLLAGFLGILVLAPVVLLPILRSLSGNVQIEVTIEKHCQAPGTHPDGTLISKGFVWKSWAAGQYFSEKIPPSDSISFTHDQRMFFLSEITGGKPIFTPFKPIKEGHYELSVSKKGVTLKKEVFVCVGIYTLEKAN